MSGSDGNKHSGQHNILSKINNSGLNQSTKVNSTSEICLTQNKTSRLCPEFLQSLATAGRYDSSPSSEDPNTCNSSRRKTQSWGRNYELTEVPTSFCSINIITEVSEAASCTKAGLCLRAVISACLRRCEAKRGDPLYVLLSATCIQLRLTEDV